MSLFNFDTRTLRLVLAGATLALAGGALGTGCGGGNLETVEGFCSQLAAADCSYSVVSACFGSSDATIQTDTDSCINARRQVSKCNPRNLTYHPEFADACISQHQVVFNSATIDAATYATLNDACLAVFNRGRPEGSECTQDTDCDVGYAGLRCITRVGGNGSCQVPKPVGGGASCKDPSAQCPTGTYCDAGFHCVEVGLEGDMCGAGQPCGVGTRCVDSICSKQLPNGTKCDESSDCIGGFCLGASNDKGLCSASYVFAFGSSTCIDFTQF
ncbi:Hypothetical protein A7982_08585 [Minicystis rosea]|nr:Hypothetical protein A7982_08585 [Minicystis rosea]